MDQWRTEQRELSSASDPPISTEQVPHPDKYWAHEMPVEVDLPELAGRLGPGWLTMGSDVFGELALNLILELGEPSGSASVAAAGWGGDRRLVLEQDGRPALVLRTVWDTSLDAQEFFDSFANDLRKR